MKFVYLFVSLLLFSATLICQTDSAASNETSPPPVQEISVSGGLAYTYLPYEFSKYWNPGMHAGVGYGLSFTPGDYGYSSLMLLADYGSFELKESAFREGMKITDPTKIVTGGKTQVFTVTANYKGTLAISKTSIAPFFTIGIGYIYFRSDSILVDNKNILSIESDALSTITWSFGVGVDIPVNEMFVGFVQAKSVIGAFDRPRQYFPITAGLRLRF
ncbi:MAG: hypothetical protein HZB59_08750 [Ignavibacteriales bacterium]|nr:hypothetical protein [Ignavibacteriales bacterium]